MRKNLILLLVFGCMILGSSAFAGYWSGGYYYSDCGSLRLVFSDGSPIGGELWIEDSQMTGGGYWVTLSEWQSTSLYTEWQQDQSQEQEEEEGEQDRDREVDEEEVADALRKVGGVF